MTEDVMAGSANPLLAYYLGQLEHQKHHSDHAHIVFPGTPMQPWDRCLECMHEDPNRYRDEATHGVKKRYSWAVPNGAALDAIAKHSPKGVVEIGAGGGYWAKMLRDRGVDVIAYDPAPPGRGEPEWHSGKAWSEVLLGDHTAVLGHPDRTLLTVWPSCSEGWAAAALELFSGDTVVYVGEGPGGCTADDRFHSLLGEHSGCWCFSGECDCTPAPEPLFGEVDSVDIPQWWGIHDRLKIYKRVS
jgi:hypothetical protein